jgi:hypothetical protein
MSLVPTQLTSGTMSGGSSLKRAWCHAVTLSRLTNLPKPVPTARDLINLTELRQIHAMADLRAGSSSGVAGSAAV